jgi:hypothetical protein
MPLGAVKVGLFAAAGGFGETGAGYFGGGLTGAGKTDVIRKLLFSTDSAATLAATLSADTSHTSGMANSPTAGYVGGGLASVYITTVDKLTFSTDGVASLGTGLSSARLFTIGLGNAGVAGYFAGGFAAAPATTVDKFAFSDDSRTTLGTGLDGASNTGEGMSNSGTAGYVGAGYIDLGGGFVYTDIVYKITYSDDSMSTLVATLNTAMRYGGGMANVGTAGYIAGGHIGGSNAYLDTVNKFSFSDDSRTTLGTGLSQGLYSPCGAAQTGTAGYFAGGTCCAEVSWTKQTQAEKFAFADDSRSVIASVFATGTTTGAAGFANEGTF